jgi:hypothetical protein
VWGSSEVTPAVEGDKVKVEDPTALGRSVASPAEVWRLLQES